VVVIHKEKRTKTESGIIIATNNKADERIPQLGKVVSIGPDVNDIGIDDYVVFEAYAGLEFQPEDEDLSYVILNEEDIRAIYTQDEE